MFSAVSWWRSTARHVAAFCVLVALGSPLAQAQSDEPIANIGHGTFFDREGNQIVPTTEFVAGAQAWYRNKLLSSLDAAKQEEFAAFERQLNEGLQAYGQERLILQQRSLDWLAENAPDLNDGGRTLGKVRALEYALNWKLPDRQDAIPEKGREEFNLDPELQKRLQLPQFTPISGEALSATLNSGQLYINECTANGVPIPPPIGQMDPAGLSGWKTQGFIPIGIQFIGQDMGPSPAEIRTFQVLPPSPQEGMCIALPRYSTTTRAEVRLDGVICLGRISSKVCFWDNQMRGRGFRFPAGTVIPIGVPNLMINPAGQYQAGGFELEGGSGGVCTDCHAGQNPYIIHPRTDLENASGGSAGLRMGDMGSAPLNLPMFSATRYDPLVPASWPQNRLSMSPRLVPAACDFCHFNGGQGGAFPHLSSELNGLGASYCQTTLAQAITRTMPPGSPGSEAANPAVVTFRNWCGSPVSAGPSDRGDPHITTNNGINYDFQAAGEFTALRNSATLFELQTRQTPVSTTFTPGANAHTGLASCVSLNSAAALRVGKRRVTYQPRPGRVPNAEGLDLRIDGKPVRLSDKGIDLGGGNVINKAASGGGIDVNAADGTRVIITPNFWASEGYWYLNVEVVNTPAREGVMADILPGEWLPLAPDGSSFGPAPVSLADRHILLNHKFADAWRVTPATSLFDYAAGTSTADFTDPDWPPESGKPCNASIGILKPPEPMNAETAQKLCSKIDDKAVFENCVLDLTATGDAAMLQAYLLTLKLRAGAQP